MAAGTVPILGPKEGSERCASWAYPNGAGRRVKVAAADLMPRQNGAHGGSRAHASASSSGNSLEEAVRAGISPEEGIEAFERVRARHPEAILVGFGVKAPKQPLPFAEFHENLPQERLAWLYSRCPIFLCPSWDEGLGMPSMEAMACGAALCTYDNGGCRDYAIDGRTAVVAPRRDLDALTRGLERLLEDAGLRRRVAREGQEFVRTRFDWERATARLEAILAAR